MQRDSITFRDSAGITIASSAGPGWTEATAWRVTPQPTVIIGKTEGEEPYLLDRVTDAVRLTDGRIAVANGGTQEIRFYDSHGRHVTSVGGRGDGPGEYQGLRTLYVMSGDSLFVPDVFASRFSVLDSSGRFVRSYSAGWGLAAPLGLLHDGRLITLNYADRQLAAALGYARVPMHLLLYAPGGEEVDTITTVPGAEEFRVQLGRGIANYEVPFGRRTTAIAWGNRIYIGTGDVFQIETRHPDGSVDRLIRAELPTRPVTSADVDTWRRAVLERATERSRPAVEKFVREVPIPATMPAYSGFAVDRAGNVWVRLYSAAPESDADWQVLDWEGRWLGRMTLPPGLRLTEIGADYVLGVARDPMGVEYVQLHRIEKPARTRTTPDV